MDELIPISITIADRSYRIKVEPADEESVRNTAKFINNKVTELKQSIAGKDMQDYVAMTLIWLATQPANTVGSILIDTEMTEGLDRLETLVDKALAANGQ